MKNGVQFLLLAVASFFLFWVEAIVLSLENWLYGYHFLLVDWVPSMFHWMLIGILWLLGAFFLWRYSTNKLSYNFFGYHKLPNKNRFALAGILVLVLIFVHYVQCSFQLKSIHGILTSIKQFGTAGMFAQILRIVYLAGAVSLMALIVIFGQKAAESWSKYNRIPWGGLTLTLTYGCLILVIYGFSSGAVAILESVIIGIIYIILRKNIRYTYVFMMLAFLL